MKKILYSLLLLSISFPALSESNQSWWKFWNSAEETVTTIAENQLFSTEERSILHDYLRNSVSNKHDSEYGDKKHKKDKKKKALPPGLQKKVARGGQLPPGWQKKVARGEVLDGELYNSSISLPSDIIDILPTSPDGTSIRRIEDKVVRVIDATGVILDVLTGAK